MKKKLLFLAAAVLLCIGVFAYFQYRNTLGTSNMTTKEFSTASKALSSRDFDTAINTSLSVLQNPSSPVEKGQFKLILAESLWARNQNDDRVQAVKYYKQVVNDYSIPARVRALALNDISIVAIGNSLAFYQANFSDAPYGAFLPPSGSDTVRLYEAYSKILKLSDDTYQTSFAEYALAGSYYTPLIYLKNNATNTPEEIAKTIQSLIEEGDSRNDSSLYSPYPLLLGYLYRALGMAMSGRILNDPPVDQREAAYQLVVTTAAQFPQNPTAEGIALRARFYNANMLSIDAPERKADILTILKPFSEVSSSTDLTFFTALKNRPSNDGVRAIAIKLGEISPDFKNFFEGL
jgi:hypothetical protein